MSENKTIAAISTALSPSGIGVIRVSGKDALLICDKIFRGRKKLSEIGGYTSAFGKLYDAGGEFIDEAVATVFREPNSYTGEDTVELSCHGSPFLLQKALRVLCDCGAAVATKGEFTKRALLNKKLTLTEAEAVIDIINAESAAAAKCAFSNKNGALGKKIGEISEGLISLQAEISAIIDFPDEDLTDIPREEIYSRLSSLLSDLRRLKDSFSKGQLILRGIPTAIVGKPNAGKSSIMNLLSRDEKSIVTNIPGTTRDVVETRVSLGDIILNLSDTAGLRNTDDTVEKIGVRKTREKMETSALLLCIFDLSEDLSEEDSEIINETRGRERIAILNKSDKDKKLDTRIIEENFPNRVVVSAKSGSGLSELEDAIISVCGLGNISLDDGIISNERQYEAVSSAERSLSEAFAALKNGATEDIVGLLMEETLSALLALTGERATDKILENVFSRFCIGK